MFGFFTWLRTQVKNAVLAGISDATAEALQDGDQEQAAALLRQRLTALPPPTEPEDGEPVGKGNGRRKAH